MKGGDRKTYNDWIEKIWRDKHVSIDTKKDSEITDFPDSFVWL